MNNKPTITNNTSGTDKTSDSAQINSLSEKTLFAKLVNFNAIRGTMIIVTCMVLGKYFNFTSPVYLAFFPVLLATRLKQANILRMIIMLTPAVLSALLALLVSELFQDHPFIIWTISLFYFDWLRRRANTSAKLASLVLPIFIWIINVVLAQLPAGVDLPANLREITLSILVCILVTKLMFWLIPSKDTHYALSIMPISVSFQQRFIALALIGCGTAFLMIVNMTSAIFCLVPVISAAIQVNRQGYITDVKQRLLTQVGGCSLSVVFTFLLAGHQDIISYYVLCLSVMVYLFLWSLEHTKGNIRNIQADALLATVLPIQLYLTQHGITLKGAYLRGWQLSITLALMFALHLLTEKKSNQ